MGERDALSPTRDPQVTVVDLLEVLLDRGVHLNLDLIITVADIPLIGVNLRATVAGLETMLEYGMMRSWDERTRAWVRERVARDLDLADGEEIVAKMPGGHHHDDDLHPRWRPGHLYLTSRRLVAFRRDPREILWQTDLRAITAVTLRTEPAIGGEERVRLHVDTAGGTTTVLSAHAPDRLRDLLAARGAAGAVPGAPPLPPAPAGDGPLLEGSAWFSEQQIGHPVWRGGTATLDRTRGLTWQGGLDRRPAVRVAPEMLTGVTVEDGDGPTAGTRVIAVAATDGVVRLAVEDAAVWEHELDTLRADAAAAPPVGSSR